MGKPHSNVSVYIHGSERKIGPFCDSHKSAVTSCQKLFPALAHATEVGFYAIDLVISGSKGHPLEICAEVWEDTASRKMVVVDKSSKILVVQDHKPGFRKAMVDIKTMTGKTVSVMAEVSGLSIGALKERIQQLDGTPARLQQFICNGVKMTDDEDLDLFHWETVRLEWKQSK